MTSLSWASILRLGLVQMSLGSIVVLTTSLLNRLMTVELALPATLAGALVALHYGVQITRPRWGFASDTGGNRTFWIIVGMVILGAGGMLAALGVVVMDGNFWTGLLVSVVAYILIGLGVGAAGTSLLALLATGTAPRRRAAAAMTTWIMMIAGFAITSGIVGAFLDPYSHGLMLRIVAIAILACIAISILAVHGIERRTTFAIREIDDTPFMTALRKVWQEPKARYFTIFVFLSMFAYFMQELILEPYAGLVFGYTPGQSTTLTSFQNQGALIGMIVVGLGVSWARIGTLKGWVVAGCLLSGLAHFILAGMGQFPDGAPLSLSVAALGLANGVFAIAAIGMMMQLAGDGEKNREGMRMGLWGAAQAVAAALSEFSGAGLSDVARSILPNAEAYGAVFAFEGFLFIAAGIFAWLVLSDTKAPGSNGAHLVPGE